METHADALYDEPFRFVIRDSAALTLHAFWMGVPVSLRQVHKLRAARNSPLVRELTENQTFEATHLNTTLPVLAKDISAGGCTSTTFFQSERTCVPPASG